MRVCPVCSAQFATPIARRAHEQAGCAPQLPIQVTDWAIYRQLVALQLPEQSPVTEDHGMAASVAWLIQQSTMQLIPADTPIIKMWLLGTRSTNEG